MKKCLLAVVLSAGLLSWNAFANSQDIGWVNDAETNLSNDDLANANSNLELAVAFNPANDNANVLLAATRLAVLAQTPAGSNFLNALGISPQGRDFYDLTVQYPTNSKGEYLFPNGYNSGTAISFYTNIVMPAISASLTNLANVTDPGFQLYLPGTVSLGSKGSDDEDVTLDYGDVQVMRTLLTAGQFLGCTLSGNNADADLNWIETNIDDKALTIQSLLKEFPSFGSTQNKSALAESEATVTNAIALYFGASYFILNERTVTNALFMLPQEDLGKEAKFRTQLTNALSSLVAPTEFAPGNIQSTVYAEPYFSGAISPRSLVPSFNGDTYVNNSVPSYTFGGILPDLPAYVTESKLRNSFFGSRAGIYLGNVQDDTFGDPSAGNFGFFFNSSGQAAYILGFDADTVNGNSPYPEDGGFDVPVTVNAENKWQVSNSTVTGSGSIGKNGNFSGELNFSDGDTVELNDSYEVSPPGSFQSAAGYYTGSVSGTDDGQHVSGSIDAILAPDGELVFREIDSSGQDSDGGTAQLDQNGAFNGITTVGGTTVSGTNTSSTQITGSFIPSDGNGSGSFTLNRQASISYDTAPTITTGLPPALTVGLSSTTTFQLSVSGSAPLDYQWYWNGNPIAGAITNTLVVSNNLWTTTGTNTIYATVNNAIGGTTSIVSYVTVETTLPPLASYSGIYIGDQNLYDNEGNLEGLTDNEGFNGGSFAVYINTNGQSAIIGYDEGDANAATDFSGFGVYVPFTMTKNGDWISTTTTYNAYGYVDNDADFFGEIDYTNGVSVFLDGAYESPAGPYQTSAGYYTGTFTANGGGSLYGIVAPDAEIFYVPTRSSGPIDGGSSQFDSTNYFTSLSVGQATVSGTINTNTFVITGNYVGPDSGGGTIKLTRSGEIPTPPAITNDLPFDVFAQLGKNATFSIGVSGTQPFFYQWYFGGNPISGATGSTLTVSNNLWTTTGDYTIQVTVSNFVGSTTSRLCNVAVLAETNLPAISITAPNPGQLWSNSTFTVTGTASDPLAVTGVVCSVNGLPQSFNVGPGSSVSWSDVVALMPGSNTISAYAINEGAIDSKTSVVLMDYVQVAGLTVITNHGSANPDYNGQNLRIGDNYSMTASANAGFQFTNWVGSISGVQVLSTNKPTILFQMQKNLVLQAYFVDALKPFLKITNATSGMLVSNNNFTVEGVVTDDEEVATVNYSLLGAATTVDISNNIAGWQAPLSLTAGTNVFSVYATATNGNYSTTDTVDIVFLMTNQLTVETSGKGTISPDYSNAWLFDGRNYTMTANPASGFVFSNWVGSLNETQVLSTNKPTVTFMMESNLVMQAIFKDTLKPYLQVTNPKSLVVYLTNQPTTYTVEGVATDDEEVASVIYSYDGSPYTNYANLPGNSWNATNVLTAGTNVFKVYAQATNGNDSATDTVDIVLISPNPLTVITNGRGTITPASVITNNLDVGFYYSLTANPGNGFIFSNWTGGVGSPSSIYTNKTTVKFLMETGLVMQANFIDTLKPYLKVTNPISSVVYVTNPIAPYVVSGVATDDESVATVKYSFNHGPYLPALISDGAPADILPAAPVQVQNYGPGVEWSEPVSLTAATNTFSVYALATNGNYSVTDTVEIISISPNPLMVITNGHGTITPASNITNNLDVGFYYSLTANPANGFIFSNWTGGVGSPSSIYTNKTTVKFLMETGLVMQANMIDTLKPYLKVTNPVSSFVFVTNPITPYTFAGVATDDEAIASVNYSFNSGSWTAAATNGIEWSVPLSLLEGTNTFAVYAQATNGNVSTTNEVTIIRRPSIMTFLIASNMAPAFYVDKPEAQLSFDGTNYLVVYRITTGGGTAVGQFVSPAGTLVGETMLLNGGNSDGPPYLDFDGTNYLVAWAGTNGAVDGVFVSRSGTVGPVTQLSDSTTVDQFSTVVYGDGVYLLVWSDDRAFPLAPDDIYGAQISASAGTNYGDILISQNGEEDQAGGISAAFDGANFLTVWGSVTNDTSINGRLVTTTDDLFGPQILIYTNSTPAGDALPNVTFDGGTNYLVLFNTGVVSNTATSSYHILGRFVTTSGTVLTNQVTLTSDAGPQVVAGADFDGTNYLATWNQGLNPFKVDTSTTLYARFFDPQGKAMITEFPIWTTLPGEEIPTWAPVYWDGVNYQFVLVGGMGHMLSASPMTYTNSAINGAIIKP